MAKKWDLVSRNTQEIVKEKELKNVLRKRKPSIYCGYEPSGALHLGHLVTVTKLMDFAEAGFKVTALLADLHALLNRKGSQDFIDKQCKKWKKGFKALGLKAKVVRGSSFQLKENYWKDVLGMSLQTTIKRGLRSMKEIARDVEHARISQIIYPLMQIQDIKALGVDVALGGKDQRKVHMLGRELLSDTFVAVHVPLITSLKGSGEKMSSSVRGSFIEVTDSKKDIEKKIKSAYCPKSVKENPVLDISRLIVFPHLKVLKVERKKKFGGDVEFRSQEELKKAFSSGDLHPQDLKNSVARSLEEIISPARKKFG